MAPSIAVEPLPLDNLCHTGRYEVVERLPFPDTPADIGRRDIDPRDPCRRPLDLHAQIDVTRILSFSGKDP